MDYRKIYNNLIRTKGTQAISTNEYYENHHIVPKCLGGSNDPQNLIKLTYREHYIAHLLLSRIYKTNSGIQYAFLCMLRKQPTGERILTSRMFETIKKRFSEYKKFHCNLENPGKSQNSRNSARKRMLEKNPTKINPAGNRTAQPIRVYFENGDVKEYSYAKKFCIENNVPYATMKVWLKNNTGNSKKHKILRIERI